MSTQPFFARISAQEFLPSSTRDQIRNDPRLSLLFGRLHGLSCREAPSLLVAAGFAHCSEVTLRRKLTRAGLSWREFVAGWRLEEARRIQRATGEPLRSIAPRVGYASVATLSRALRRTEGSGTLDELDAACAPLEGDR
jgi:AraC-like DNA-binding protein